MKIQFKDFQLEGCFKILNIYNSALIKHLKLLSRCIQSSVKKDIKVCEIKAWCPLEHDSDRKEDNLIRNVLNYTIFIRNNIEFKKFNKRQLVCFNEISIFLKAIVQSFLFFF